MLLKTFTFWVSKHFINSLFIKWSYSFERINNTVKTNLSMPNSKTRQSLNQLIAFSLYRNPIISYKLEQWYHTSFFFSASFIRNKTSHIFKIINSKGINLKMINSENAAWRFHQLIGHSSSGIVHFKWCIAPDGNYGHKV